MLLWCIDIWKWFFKPNISSMVTNLYPKGRKKQTGYSLHHILYGYQLGAFLGQFICPALGDVVDANGTRDIFAFKWGFLRQVLPMLIGHTYFLFVER